jgi:Flp pilus assembly protein TadD
LLLEALKKAELAKQQGAAGQAGASGADASLPAAMPELPPAELAADKPLITRDRLPDITQPLEILSEDLPSAAAPKRERPPVSTGAEPVAPASSRAIPVAERPERSAASPAVGQDQDRASARQLFEAKTPDYNPRRPFYYAVGAIGVVAIGVVGYFAYQVLAPRPSFYTGPPGGTTTPQPPATVATAPAPITQPSVAPAPPPAPPTAPAPSAPTAEPPLAAAPTASAQPVPPPPQPSPAAPKAGKAGSGKVESPPPAGPARAAAAAGSGIGADSGPAASRPAASRPTVRVTPSGPRIDPAVERGWQALQAGNLAQARDEYSRALQANPTDRDALLGLAAIDTREQDLAAAEARYTRVLELDPRDAYAHAALLSLRGQADPVQSESRLKTLVAQQPDANVLSFSLGNQYATQRRWAEAQQAYFRALSGDPENADYAFNLAVSLDHMRQSKLAMEYYQRALALAGSRPVGFNTAQVEARVRELQRQ